MTTVAIVQERRRAIVELAMSGMPPRLIAAETGETPQIVYYDLKVAREKGVPIPKFKTGVGGSGSSIAGTCRPVLSKDIAKRLSGLAEPRGTTPAKLAAQIVETVLRENLLEAVLDE